MTHGSPPSTRQHPMAIPRLEAMAWIAVRVVGWIALGIVVLGAVLFGLSILFAAGTPASRTLT